MFATFSCFRLEVYDVINMLQFIIVSLHIFLLWRNNDFYGAFESLCRNINRWVFVFNFILIYFQDSNNSIALILFRFHTIFSNQTSITPNGNVFPVVERFVWCPRNRIKTYCFCADTFKFITTSAVVYYYVGGRLSPNISNVDQLSSCAPALVCKALKLGNVKRRAAGAAMLDAIIPGRNKSGVDSFRPISNWSKHRYKSMQELCTLHTLRCAHCTMCTS